MKLKNRMFILPCILLLCAVGSNVSAGLITTVSGLDIDGIAYDVTFHPEQSFHDLWDANRDGIFGNDTSVFNAQPTFFGNGPGAFAAANALINFFPADGSMGTFERTPSCGAGPFCDSFAIPLVFQPGTTEIVLSVNDGGFPPDLDSADTSFTLNSSFLRSFPNTSFVQSSTRVPEPATMALIGLGLAGIGWSRRKWTRPAHPARSVDRST